jgi:hypothetical protein
VRVKLLSVPSGSGFDSLRAGDEVDFPPEDAVRLIEQGHAAPIAEVQVERAVKKPAPEKRKK